MKKQIVAMGLIAAGMLNLSAPLQATETPKFQTILDAKDERLQAFATLLFYLAQATKLRYSEDKFSDAGYYMELSQYTPEKTIRAALEKAFHGIRVNVYNDAVKDTDDSQVILIGAPKPGDKRYAKEYLIFLQGRYQKAYEKLPANLRHLYGDPTTSMPASLEIEI